MASRKRKSLSSILKSQASPSRMALSDLNPNLNAPTDETTHFEIMEQKKKRRSSRRVSFAETYQVKEFLKDSDRKELGLWDNSDDGSNSSAFAEQKQPANPARDGEPIAGVSNGPDHITGLETLLSGTIKEEARSMASNMETIGPQTGISGGIQDEKPVKSSFLQSFIAADPPSVSGEQLKQQNLGNVASISSMPGSHSAMPWSTTGAFDAPSTSQTDSSFKSNFLQAFMAADPSPSSQAPEGRDQGDITRIFSQGDDDAGLELTACMNSAPAAEVDSRRGKDDNAGEITRIFGGHGEGFGGNGMDMTTCMGGFNTTHYQNELKQPAAESTRIFGNENTDNMDLTCMKDFTFSSKSVGQTMNTTTFGGTMNFTAVVGKFSDSHIANLPDESTGRLLGRVDDLLGIKPSGSNEAEAASVPHPQDVSRPNKDLTRRSVVLDTIHEVSSSTASMLNVTAHDRSASAAKQSDPIPEEDDMDITTGNGAPLAAKTGPDGDDRTRFFGEEDPAGMEMTCAIGGLLPVGGTATTISSTCQSTEVRSEHTRVFQAEDDADMEMTCAGKGLLSAHEYGTLSSSGLKQHPNEDNTTRFLSASTGNTERTSCYGDLPEGLTYQIKRKKQKQKEMGALSAQTDDTTSMDLTTCVRAPSSIVSAETINQPKTMDSNKPNVGEQTCFFGGNDGGNMEMTECLSQQSSQLPAVQPQVNTSMRQASNSQNASRFSFGEETRLFRADDAGDMELTECQTRFQSSSKVQQTKVASSDDRTQIYQSEDQCGMELTVNHSKISAGHAGSNQLVTAKTTQVLGKLTTSGFEIMHTQKTTDDDKTMVFGGQEDADMEMTTCVGALPRSGQPAPTAVKVSGVDLSRFQEDGTHFFQAEDTAKMDMTTCIGDLPNVHPSSHQYSQSKAKDSNPCEDHTQIFQAEDTAHMEMTACVGTLPKVNPLTGQAGHGSSKPLGSDPSAISDDRTHFFQAEDTANMEMTTCLGTLPSSHQGANTIKHSIGDPAPFSDDHTRIFQAEDTANMEMTACVGTLPSSHNPTIKSSMGDPAPLGDDHTHTLPGAFSMPSQHAIHLDSTSEHKEQLSSKNVVKQDSVLNASPKLNASEDAVQDKTLDNTYTLSSPTMKQEIEQELMDENDGGGPMCADGQSPGAQETSHMSRKSFLATEDVSVESTLPEAKLDKDISSSVVPISQENTTTHVDQSQPTSSAASSHSVMEQSQVVDEQQMNALKESFVLPDWICDDGEKGILDELPIENDNTEDLCVTAAKRPRLDESAYSLSQLNMSCLTADLSHLPLLPKGGVVSISDFLQMFCEDINDLPVGKRSIMCPQKPDEEQTVGDLLKDACIIKPKADMFEWAINFLTPTVKRLREAVEDQEEKYSRENSALITQLQNADAEKSAFILKRIKGLHKYCTVSTKAKLKEWRLKMISNTMPAMEESYQHLEPRVSKLTSSVDRISESLDQMKTVEAELDSVIASLENTPVPTEEEKLEYLETSRKLASLTSELQEKEEARKRAESERSSLEGDKSRLQEENFKLEDEKEELRRRETEKGSGENEQKCKELKNEVIMMQRFQECRLQAFNQASYRFTFLQNSVILNLQYENNTSDSRLTELTLESRLADDANASAQLAHAMFFGSVNTDRLRSLFAARAALPQMMQHLSESAVQARILEAEVRKLDFWHPVTVSNTRLSIKYSSVEAHSMFQVHLDLQPGQYPFSPVPHSCSRTIGKISEESINAAVDAVKPGWKYITRLSNAVDAILKTSLS